MSHADGYVLPKPGIPKTLGILNIIFGVLLVLLGICGIGGLLVAPAAMDYVKSKAGEVQAKLEAQQKADLKAIDDRIAAAKDDEEKKAIEQERANAVTNQPKINPVDMTAVSDVLKDPKIMAINYAGAISGLVMHVLLLVSGIGLIRLTPWGRSLAMAWGGLQVVQVLALLAATIFIALPINRPMTDKQIEKLKEAAQAPGAGPAEASALQMTEIMAKMAVPLAVGQSLSGLIYPVVVLILLSTAGARAACLARKPESVEDL